jgi:ABC-type lipoprotein release transport system permease subunit
MVLWSLLGIGAVLVFVLMVITKVPLSYNLRNLKIRWRTSAMAALAFTLVTALLIVMLAFVNGMNRLTAGSGQPGNVLVLAEGSTDESFSNLNIGDVAEIEVQPDVVRGEDGRPMASRETYMVVNQPVPADAPPGRPKRRFLQLRGVEDARLSAEVHNLRLIAGGTWLSPSGSRLDTAADGNAAAGQPMIEVILGEGIARELGRDRSQEKRAAARNPKRLEVGDVFTMGEDPQVMEEGGSPRARKWIVVGVMDSSGSTFDSELWAKQSLVAPIFGKDTFTSLVVRTRDDQAARKFTDFLNNASQQPEPGKASSTESGQESGQPAGGGLRRTTVNAQVETEYYAGMTQMTEVFLAAIIVVTVFISIGGIFGVMNTMFAAISQRIKDIGILRLLGYSRRQILASFLMESLVIALVGGILGCLLGSAANGLTATAAVTGHTGGGKLVVLKLVVDISILAIGVLVSLSLGLFGGLLPALSAMRLKPLKALR